MESYLRQGPSSFFVVLILFFGVMSSCARAQQSVIAADEEEEVAEQSAQNEQLWRQTVVADAHRMGGAFSDFDEDLFISYLYPGFVEIAGGVEGAREMIRRLDREIREAGGEIIDWSVEEPHGEFVEYQGEIQVMLRSSMEMTIGGITVHGKHDLIGISDDGGNRWYFITTNNSELESLRELLPNLSPDLKFQPTQLELSPDQTEAL